jgi:hypothetical protein
MPEIDVIHVWRVRNDPPAYEATTPDTSLIHTPDEHFGVQDLVEIGAEYGVDRWAERTDDDEFGEDVVLVGWAEAPIGRDDVERSYHQGHHRGEPMVDIKVHDTDLPTGAAFADLLSEFELDPLLAALPQGELRDLIQQFIAKDDDNAIFNMACESNFEVAENDAKWNFFPEYSVKIWTAGRQGGWLVVEGLPDVDSWDAKLLTAWSQFETSCQGLVADVPRAMAWHVLANRQAELAGRVVRVELTMVLSDADLDGVGNDPDQWDWRGMLDLGPDSSLRVKTLPS